VKRSRFLTWTGGLSAMVVASPGVSLDIQGHKTVYFYSGSCDRLATPERKQDGLCGSSMLRITYQNGRHSFAFPQGNDEMISFSGVQDSPRAGARMLILDAITTATTNWPPVTTSAEGSCTYSIFKNVLLVRCLGQTATGKFEASFKSNGQAPSVSYL
jgi:hypothetical protein